VKNDDAKGDVVVPAASWAIVGGATQRHTSIHKTHSAARHASANAIPLAEMPMEGVVGCVCGAGVLLAPMADENLAIKSNKVRWARLPHELSACTDASADLTAMRSPGDDALYGDV
jgi:hypothetical protein